MNKFKNVNNIKYDKLIQTFKKKEKLMHKFKKSALFCFTRNNLKMK